MCRLLGVAGVGAAAEHFLTGASNSLRELGRLNPHGAGVGGFVGGAPVVEKSALAAHLDPAFGRQPWIADSPTMVGHVRYATVSAPAVGDSHPFVFADGAAHDFVFAQNGSIGEMHRIEDALGPYEKFVHGRTDSERYGALVRRFVDEADGNVEVGLKRAVEFLAKHTPMTAINMTLATKSDLYALRYWDMRPMVYAQQGAREASAGQRLLHGATPQAIEGAAATRQPATIVASEPLDTTSHWQTVQPGQLVHVRAEDLHQTVTQLVDRPPARLLDDAYRAGGAVAGAH